MMSEEGNKIWNAGALVRRIDDELTSIIQIALIRIQR